jgi:hypothetical protein
MAAGQPVRRTSHPNEPGVERSLNRCCAARRRRANRFANRIRLTVFSQRSYNHGFVFDGIYD